MKSPEVLFVAWQEPDSRRILPIARLLKHHGDYEFAYINAVEEATRLGFKPLLSFPELGTVYNATELPPLFTNRLMPKSRPAFSGYITELGLTAEQAEPFAVLARSEGRRATDSLEIFSGPLPCADGYEGFFLARGVRHLPDCEEALKSVAPGDRLYVMADVQNDSNPGALLLRTASKHVVGYFPDHLANELHEARADLSTVRVTVSRVNPPPAPTVHRLLCHFTCPSELGTQLYRGPRYHPLSSRATQFAA
jgi:hypothetical protein